MALPDFHAPFLIAGPCSLESEALSLEVAESLVQLSVEQRIPVIFKGSWDKANRTKGDSYRGVGLEEGLRILALVKEKTDLAVLTDVHHPEQAVKVAGVVDVLQTPAFLCRQTDLLEACGATGLPVNVKKGQFLHPEDMGHAVEKVRLGGEVPVLLCERGSTFGYRNLVVDMRGIPIMKRWGPVVFDATHSVQLPGGGDGVSSGQREFIEPLAKAALAAGAMGLFLETHPNPEKAPSDGPNMVPLDEMDTLIGRLAPHWGL
ncbi:3-deoxy-8-phosphooctulonate synthase [bacterium]|nr:3-deoxy-8-phosphooctulonate synthase [bacterium]